MEFYGRKNILDLLTKRANGLSDGYRQNIAIIGEELIGKTHLIKYWLSLYSNNYIVPVYIEIKHENLKSFTEKFIGTFLYSFLQNSQIPLKEDLSYLLLKSENYIPKTVKLCKELLAHNKKRPNDTFIKLVNLLEFFHAETKKHCCLILDEFHRLEEIKTKDFYSQWRKYIMLNKNTMYVLTSSRKQLAENILSLNLNLLFGNFEKIEIDAFDIKTAQIFIQTKLKNLCLENKTLDFIVDFSASRPFYINTICDSIIDLHAKTKQTNLTIDSLILSLENIFLNSWGILNKRFSELLNKSQDIAKNDYAPKVLLALANGLNKLPEIVNQVHLNKKETSSLLDELSRCDFIYKTADVYLLSDRVFGFWIKSIYATNINTFALSYENQRQLFAKKIGLVYNLFIEAQLKATSERIIELFNQFADESVQLEKKQLKLNHFKEVKLLNINGKKIKEGILGRATNSLWIAGIKDEGCVQEEDMLEFIGVCKKFKYNKSQKKIFITLDEIDANARLIAKEEKIITWDISCLNSLLEIYGKPRIIR